eukprot:scaffold1557_cov246-Pinguiococcus_pyrenoidosus.AAC.20
MANAQLKFSAKLPAADRHVQMRCSATCNGKPQRSGGRSQLLLAAPYGFGRNFAPKKSLQSAESAAQMRLIDVARERYGVTVRRENRKEASDDSPIFRPETIDMGSTAAPTWTNGSCTHSQLDGAYDDMRQSPRSAYS